MQADNSFNPESAELLGSGARRRCYQMPDRDQCIKFYHLPQTLPRRTRLKNRYAIALARHWRAYNINHREWRYHQKLIQRLPPEVLSIFPEHTEPVYSKTHGWGIIETLIRNSDDSLSRQIPGELKRSDDIKTSCRIFSAVEELLDHLVNHTIGYFDHGNIMVQWRDNKNFKLRVADFEPTCRALVPGLTSLPFYVRCKLRRRGSRFLRHLANIINSRAGGNTPCITPLLASPTLWQRFKLASGLEMWRGRCSEGI